MRQKKSSDYSQVISMEEYLIKRKKIKENEQKKEKKEKMTFDPIWMLETSYTL